MFFKHLRITVPADKSQEIAKAFIKKFKPSVYVFSNEVSDKGVEHTHAHLEYSEEPKKQTVSDFFKKHNLSGKYYHDTLKSAPLKNLLYVFKDLDVLMHNLTDEQFEELTDKTMEINEDKKKDIKLKLIEEVKQHVEKFDKLEPIHNEDGKVFDVITKNYMRLADIARIIKDVYINKYDKLPPTKSLMFQYSVYVAQHLEICKIEVEQIYDNIF